MNRLLQHSHRTSFRSSQRMSMERLEERLALAIELGFAAAITPQTPNGDLVAVPSEEHDVLDANGNRYLFVRGSSPGGLEDNTQIADFDPGPGVLTREITSGHSGFDLCLVKLDPSANLLWVQSWHFTGENPTVYPPAMTVDQNENIYIAGSFRGQVDFDPGPGRADATSFNGGNTGDSFLMKLDRNGAFQWVRTLDRNYFQIQNVVVDGDGNITWAAQVFAAYAYPGDDFDVDFGPGTFIVTPIGELDTLVGKSTPDGDLLWVSQLGGTFFTSGMSLDRFGNVYVSGFFRGSADLDPGPGVFPVSSTIAQSGLPSFDAYVLKLDRDGQFIWAYTVEGDDVSRITRVKVDHEGNVYGAGIHRGTNDFDSGPGTAQLTSSHDMGITDAVALKLNPDGSLAWVRQFWNGRGETRGLGIDGVGNVYVAGSFTDTGDFDPGDGVFEMTAADEAAVVVSLDNAGLFRWAIQFGGYIRNGGLVALAVSENGDVHVQGDFRGTVDFDPGPGELLLDSGPAAGVFIVKLTQPVVLGDTDGDGQVDMDDVNALALALNDPTAYEATYGVPPHLRADMDGDGDLDFDDIDEFVALLAPGAQAASATVANPPFDRSAWLGQSLSDAPGSLFATAHDAPLLEEGLPEARHRHSSLTDRAPAATHSALDTVPWATPGRKQHRKLSSEDLAQIWSEEDNWLDRLGPQLEK